MPFRFDNQRAVYVEDERTIEDDDLKRIILLFLALLADEMERITREMARGETALKSWQLEMARLSKSGQVAAMLLGRGGRNVPPGRAAGFASSNIRVSLLALNRFARLIELGNEPRARTEDGTASRSRLYAAAASETFEQSRRVAHEEATDEDGKPEYSEERNVLGNAEHCPECLAETARGWVKIGVLSLPGTRICRVNCKCHLVYR